MKATAVRSQLNSIVGLAIKSAKKCGTHHVGVVYAKDWFGSHKPLFILPDDFVVCEWNDYHDGVNSHIEGRTTIAICRRKDDALLLYNKYLSDKK